MRETKFIAQNKEKWEELEYLLQSTDKDPDQLSDLFVQVTDDLSYSRTYYPNRSVRVYLNNLAQKIFSIIHRNKQSNASRLKLFWTEELPLLMYDNRKAFYLSFSIFTLSFLIGMLSCAMDPNFATQTLGQEYIQETLANIKKGDPMAIYKQDGAGGMALGITFNNTFVAFLTFVFGAFFGVGSAGILIKNGVMVGVFQYFFVQKGLFWESFLTIWVHGTLEISAIIIAGAAGLTMGQGLLFPGTLSRLQSFQISARRGIKIMAGIIPVIITAGMIEGFLTRYTDAPDWIRGLFILLCLAFVLYYFVWYPRYCARTLTRKSTVSYRLMPDVDYQLGLGQIQDSGAIFGDTFLFFRQRMSLVLWSAAGSAAFFCSTIFLFNNNFNTASVSSGLFGTLSVLANYFDTSKMPIVLAINTLIFSFLLFNIGRVIYHKAEQQEHFNTLAQQVSRGFLRALLPGFLLAYSLGIMGTYYFYHFLFLMPFFIMWYYTSLSQGSNILNASLEAFRLLGTQFASLMTLSFITSIFGLVFFFVADGAFTQFIIEIIGWNLHGRQGLLDQVLLFALNFLGYFTFCLVLQLMIVSYFLFYYTLVEIRYAGGLRERVSNIGQQRNLQGLAQE